MIASHLFLKGAGVVVRSDREARRSGSACLARTASSFILPTPLRELAAVHDVELSRPLQDETTPVQNQGKRANPSGPRSEVLRRVLDRVCTEVGRERFDRYFDRQTRVELEGHTVNVTVASGFLADVLGRRFGESLRRAAAAEIEGREPGTNVELRIHVSPPLAPPAEGSETAGEASAIPGRGAGELTGTIAPRRRIDPNEPRHTFEEFLFGESNKLAYTAAQRLVETPGTSGMVFIHGACGVGKTHLLHAAAARFKQLNPGARIRLTTAESFTNAFVTAIRGTPGSAGGQQGVEAFRRMHRNIDLLCIDDVHFLGGKEATQRELLATFESLAITGRGHPRIMLASDEHPREIAKISQQLVSRFMGGVVARIEAPEPKLRVRLLHELARRRGMALEPQAAQLLADRASSSSGPARNGVAQGASVRDLEGLLTRAAAIRLIMPDLAADQIGIIAAERALGMGEGPSRAGGSEGWGRLRRPVPVPRIASVVCRCLGVEFAELSGRGRHKTVVLARELTVVIARRLTTYSFPEIGRALGRPNHSTVLTAHKRLCTQIEAGERPKAEISGDLAGLTLGEIADRLTAMVERAG